MNEAILPAGQDYILITFGGDQVANLMTSLTAARCDLVLRVVLASGETTMEKQEWMKTR